MSTQSYYLTALEPETNRTMPHLALSVNCAGITDEKFTFSNSKSRLDYYFLYMQSGKLYTENGMLLPGDLIIFEPNYHFSYESLEPTSYLWIHFTGHDSKKILEENALDPLTIMHIGIDESIKEYFEKLFLEFIINDEKSEEMRICFLKQILILSGRRNRDDPSNRLPLKSISYINRHYTRNISIEQLADMEEMSLTAYRILFKRHTGLSPLQYINSRRVSAACTLLMQSRNSIAEISAQLGFSDPYYFSRFFKKQIGISPKQYQKKQQSSYTN